MAGCENPTGAGDPHEGSRRTSPIRPLPSSIFPLPSSIRHAPPRLPGSAVPSRFVASSGARPGIGRGAAVRLVGAPRRRRRFAETGPAGLVRVRGVGRGGLVTTALGGTCMRLTLLWPCAATAAALLAVAGCGGGG